MMSILSTSPTSIRVFDINIANALGSSEAATILQQLHYWMQKPSVGVIVDGIKYVYNTFRQWVREQFVYLTDSKFINAMKILRSHEIVKVIRHKAKQWNQTNYYSLDYHKLREWAEAESIEISEMCVSTPQEEKSQTLEMENTKDSLYESKITTKKATANSSVAASSIEKIAESDSVKLKPDSIKLSSSPVCDRINTSSTKQNIGKDKSSIVVEQIINLKWKEQIKDLDNAGISVNKTLIGLLKSYKFEQVAQAIALFKSRKRSQYIPNPAGYFVKALKEDWCDENILTSQSTNIDQTSVFRYWYDLACQLGYCSGQEVRDAEQWICLSGTWEKWSKAVERGYSIDYLKKIVKRNGGR